MWACSRRNEEPRGFSIDDFRLENARGQLPSEEARVPVSVPTAMDGGLLSRYRLAEPILSGASFRQRLQAL